MRDFLEYIVKNLVDNPDDVKVNEVGGTQTTILEVCLNEADTGKVIGKRGKNIEALRTLLSAVASRHKTRVRLEVIEPNKTKSVAQEANESVPV